MAGLPSACCACAAQMPCGCYTLCPGTAHREGRPLVHTAWLGQRRRRLPACAPLLTCASPWQAAARTAHARGAPSQFYVSHDFVTQGWQDRLTAGHSVHAHDSGTAVVMTCMTAPAKELPEAHPDRIDGDVTAFDNGVYHARKELRGHVPGKIRLSAGQ